MGMYNLFYKIRITAVFSQFLTYYLSLTIHFASSSRWTEAKYIPWKYVVVFSELLLYFSVFE